MKIWTWNSGLAFAVLPFLVAWLYQRVFMERVLAPGAVVASEYWGKAYLLWDFGALVRVSAPIVGSEEEAYRQVREFSRRLFPPLAGFLPG